MVLEVVVVIALYFLVKLTHDIYSHDKGGLKYPKYDVNLFLTKHDVKAFCLCIGQYDEAVM